MSFISQLENKISGSFQFIQIQLNSVQFNNVFLIPKETLQYIADVLIISKDML